MTPQDVPMAPVPPRTAPDHPAPTPVYDSCGDASGLPWVQVRSIPCARLRWLGPLYHARVQDGAADRDQLPQVIPACQCPDVTGLTRRAARRRACTRHNHRAAAGTCPGRFRLDWAI